MPRIQELPNELFHPIIEYLEEYEWLPTERFPTLTPASKRGILSARLTRTEFKKAPSLDSSFLRVLEEHPFTIMNEQALPLEGVSNSPWAQRMTTLSIRSPSLCNYPGPRDGGSWPPRLLAYMRPIILRFVNVRTVRYFPITREVLGDSARSSRSGAPGPEARQPSRLQGGRHTRSPDLRSDGDRWLQPVSKLLVDLGLRFENIATPLFGNRNWKTTCFPGLLRSNLKRLSFNICDVRPENVLNDAVISSWLLSCVSLEYLDIALTTTDTQQPTWQPTPIVCRSTINWIRLGITHCSLKELRIAASSYYVFSEDSIVQAITLFGLSKVALAHMQITSGSWVSVLDRLKRHVLESLWLLNPMEDRGPGQGVTEPCMKLVGDTGQAIAEDQRWCIRPDNVNVAPYEREWDYLGFSMFETGECPPDEP